MSKYANYGRTIYHWLGDLLKTHPRNFLLFIAIVTVMFLVPAFVMQPKENAAIFPPDNSFILLNEEINETFPGDIYAASFILEVTRGDILTQSKLYTVLEIENELKKSSLSTLFYRFNDSKSTMGIYSLADAVNDYLIRNSENKTDLLTASDFQVKEAIFNIFVDYDNTDFSQELSLKASYQTNTDGVQLWQSPALIVTVYADKEKLTNGYISANGQSYSGITALEYFTADILELMRSQEEIINVWGTDTAVQPEIDALNYINIVIPPIIILIMMLIAYIFFRSLPITLVCGGGLLAVLIWFTGFSNLIGIKNSITVDMAAPVLIMVLGISFAIHAIYRYREEKIKGYPPEQALRNSTRRVGSALLFAALALIIAFAANGVSSIESVANLAIVGSFSIFAAYLIMGLAAPTLLMWLELKKEEKPALLYVKSGEAKRAKLIGNLFIFFAEKRKFTFSIAALVMILGIIGWFNLEAKFDRQDFLLPTSDFVIGQNKAIEHLYGSSTENVYFYFKGDFNGPESLQAIQNLVNELENNKYIKPASNSISVVNAPLLTAVKEVVESEYAKQAIEIEYGVTITDNDSNGLPDNASQLSATYKYLLKKNYLLTENDLNYKPADTAKFFVYNESKNEYSALITVAVNDINNQSAITESANLFNKSLERTAAGTTGISDYGFTGNPYIFNAQYDELKASMLNSLLIALVCGALLLLVTLKSWRYLLITLIPVFPVVSAVYGAIYLLGYEINLITASIAAVTVGIVIGYNAYFIERFREEFLRLGDLKKALLNTAAGTGKTLIGSYFAMAVGFVVLVSAAIPLFAAFGVIGILIAVFSLLATITIIPGLVYVFAADNHQEKTQPDVLD